LCNEVRAEPSGRVCATKLHAAVATDVYGLLAVAPVTMWEHFRDSVHSRATNIVRDLSGRFAHADETQTNGNGRRAEHDAMKNVLTPNNIPPFTLPNVYMLSTVGRADTNRLADSTDVVDDLGKRLTDEASIGKPASSPPIKQGKCSLLW